MSEVPLEPEGFEPLHDGERLVEIEGEQWVARLCGSGAAGSGALGLGMIEAIEYARASARDRTLRCVLVQRGRFHQLYDAELAALFAGARIVDSRSE